MEEGAPAHRGGKVGSEPAAAAAGEFLLNFLNF